MQTGHTTFLLLWGLKTIKMYSGSGPCFGTIAFLSSRMLALCSKTINWYPPAPPPPPTPSHPPAPYHPPRTLELCSRRQRSCTRHYVYNVHCIIYCAAQFIFAKFRGCTTRTGDFKCREVKTGFFRKRWMQTGSSGTLMGWKSGQSTFAPLWVHVFLFFRGVCYEIKFKYLNQTGKL